MNAINERRLKLVRRRILVHAESQQCQGIYILQRHTDAPTEWLSAPWQETNSNQHTYTAQGGYLRMLNCWMF
jgi:hypothetical protein